MAEEMDMLQSLMATKTVLEYKLQRIKDHINQRLQVAEGATAVELKMILKMIGEFEEVPAGWQLKAPLVARKYYEEFLDKENDDA